MSVQTQIDRIKGNITAALTVVADKGVTVPDDSNSDDLAQLIAAIEAGGGLAVQTFATVEALPAEAEDGTIALITTDAVGNVLASDGEPETPATGDVWIELNSAADVEVPVASGQIVLAIKSVQGYSDKWKRLEAYAYVSGAWVQISKSAHLYGFMREKANSDPNTRITYIHDAVGMTPMTVNLSTGNPDYGSWKEFVDELVRPVMLKTDGTVDYELNHDDQTLRADNGEASDVASTSYDGNAMAEFRKYIWVHRSETETHDTVIFSDVQFDDTFHAYAHTNENGEVVDAFYWGMFKGSSINSKLRSVGTGSVMGNQTRATEISQAQANGNGYYTSYKSGWDFIGDILTLISKSDNSQAVFGAGRTLSSNTAAIGVGTLKNKGAFWGSSDGTSDVKVLYIEGFWGNVWEGMAGLILSGTSGIKTKMVPPYNTSGSGYQSAGLLTSGSSSGYTDTHSCTDAMGYLPKTTKGSATTYMCDGLWFNTTKTGYVLVGGSWPDSTMCGSRCVYLSETATFKGANAGSRLSFIPV